jgi:hypothetical protein
VRVRAQSGDRATGRQRWFVRVQCRPNAADALADAIAGREDVSWASTTSGGSEIVCVAFTDPGAMRGSVLAKLPRTSQVLSFTDLYLYVTGRIGALPAVHQVEIVPVLRQLKQSGTRVHNGRLVLD